MYFVSVRFMRLDSQVGEDEGGQARWETGERNRKACSEQTMCLIQAQSILGLGKDRREIPRWIEMRDRDVEELQLARWSMLVRVGIPGRQGKQYARHQMATNCQSRRRCQCGDCPSRIEVRCMQQKY
jgi:hypothetical protein